MSDTWTQFDDGKTFDDGSVWRYHQSDGQGDDAVLSFSAFDGSAFTYDVTKSVLKFALRDGAVISYDAQAHAYSIQLPNGATFQITANGASIGIDAVGNINLVAVGDILTKTSVIDSSINVQHADLDGHVHGGVQSGSDQSGPPTVPIP